MKERVLDLLRRQAGFLSGEQISHLLGVSRTTIWKAVRNLQQEGYPIEAVTRLGYRLTGEADILSEPSVSRLLAGSGLDTWIRHIAYEAETDSTNLMARRAAESGAPAVSLFLADRQTAGRGRRGRRWNSGAGDLTFTLLFRPAADPARLAPATLFAGLCAATALNAVLPVGIKWPNDLVAIDSGRKLGGILTEMLLEENRILALIIGIGINVNTAAFPPDLARKATSMLSEQGRPFRRQDILQLILQAFAVRAAQLEEPRAWLDDYKRNCLTLGRDIQVTMADGRTLDGRAVDLDADGELVIETAAGRQIIRSGEVSVRGLFGYA